MKRTWKWAIAGAVVVLLSPVAYEAAYLHVRGRAVAEADATANHFLVSLQAHQYQAAYELLDGQEKQKLTASSIRQGFETLEKPGRLDWVAPHCDEYHPSDDLRNVTLSYSVGFGEDGMPVRIKMTQTPDGWRVSYYRFNESPA